MLTACGSGEEQKKGEKNYSAEEVAAESKKLNELLDRFYDEAIDRDPVSQTRMGIKKDYGNWSDISDENDKKELDISVQNLEKIKKEIVLEKLDEQAKISYLMYADDVARAQENWKWRFHDYPVNQMGGLHSDIPALLINMHLIKDESDAKAYISRLQKMNALFGQLIVNLKIREKNKIIPPKFVFPYVMNDCRNLLSGAPFEKGKPDGDLLSDFRSKVKALNLEEAKMNALVEQASAALRDSVKPAYEKLMAYWTGLEKKATEDDGAWKLPEGDAFYDAALKLTTTTDLNAEQIHEIGLKEVERIHNEMRAIMKQVGFAGDLQAFFKFMREDKRFYNKNDKEGKEAYLKLATGIIDSMRVKLDALFITKPKAAIVVKPVESFRERSTGGAFYEEPALDGSRPGSYYVNLYNMADQALYQAEALAYHEGIPGHHMQIAIAQELQGIPKFRKLGGNTAYIEGWALYSEQLGKEVGFYKDPYSDFGRLAMELFRAARLVVDTGIHRKKWSRQKALDYFNENTPNPEGDNKKEIERYIVWPSQATGYKIGMLKIIELRDHAKKTLADKFDLREFHDVILTGGSLPLNVLQDVVYAWIDKKTIASDK